MEDLFVKNIQQTAIIKQKIWKKPQPTNQFTRHGIIKHHTLEACVLQNLSATKKNKRFISKINFYQCWKFVSQELHLPTRLFIHNISTDSEVLCLWENPKWPLYQRTYFQETLSPLRLHKEAHLKCVCYAEILNKNSYCFCLMDRF